MSKNTENKITALLIYCSAFVLTPQAYVYPIILVFGLWRFLYSINRKLLKEDILLLIGTFISIIVFIVGYSYAFNEDSRSILNSYLPYTILIVSVVFFSRYLNKEIIKYVFYLLMFEICIGIFEFIIGKPYIFAPSLSSGETEYGSTDLLYFNRVYGLSAAVSIFAQKVLIALVLLHYLKFSTKIKQVLLLVIFIGFLVSFNRTAILSGIFFLIVFYFRNFNVKTIVIGAVVLIAIVSIALNNLELILEQFFRGKDDIDYSGRDKIFEFFIGFINDNLFWGNYVQKLWYKPSINELFHAHNSYLETIASTGIVISFFLFTFVLTTAIRNKSFLFIFPFLVYSMSQFGFLWGISFLDIIFFYLLQVSAKKENLLTISDN